MRGIFFSLDTIFAVVIAVAMVVAINFFLLRAQEDPVKDLYVEKLANDILLTLVKNRTFENTNTTTVSDAFSSILPKNLGGILSVDMYNCVGPGCASFNKTTTYKVDRCRINVVDVVLVIDRSGSMCEPVAWVFCNSAPAGSKMKSAIDAAKLFVDQLDPSNDKSGLVSFSGSATLDRNLTYDKSSVKASIDGLRALGSTAIGSGISTATGHLNSVGRGSTKWAQVLLSDGQNTGGIDPITAATAARDSGIIIYTIGLGSGADNVTMTNIANITGGKYYYAPSGAELNGVYTEIARELLSTEQEVSLARTSFVTFKNSTIDQFGTAELKLCII